MTPKQARAWIPTGILVVIILAGILAAWAFQSSWWRDEDRVASPDQQTSSGMSIFTPAGRDYFNVDRVVFARLGAGAPRAEEIGLSPSEVAEVEPRVPIEVRVIGENGVFRLPLVERLTLTTVNDQLVTITLDHEGNGSYPDLIKMLERMSPSLGWTDEDFEKLAIDLSAAAKSDDGAYSATMRPSIELGMQVETTVVIRQGISPDLLVELQVLG